jgi:F0F1-type ATP synthase membrane subunit b/b'
MVKKNLELGESHHIVVEQVGGDLHVKGWKRNEVLLKTSCEGDVKLEQSGDKVLIDCPEDCILYAPHGAIFEVNQVGKDAVFKSLDGALQINQVGSDLNLRDVGMVEAQTIGAGMSARRVRGDMNIQNVGGSVSVRDVDGQFSCQEIGGSLRLSDISGGVSATAGGSARVNISPVPWQAYAIKAGGNIKCVVPEDLNAEVSFTSGSQSIRIKFPHQSQDVKDATYQHEFGEGGTPITLDAGGGINLVGYSADWDDDADVDMDFGNDLSEMIKDITQQTTDQINAHLGVLDSHLSDLSVTLENAGLSEERAQEINQRLQQAREKATQRAQDAAHHAQRKLERKLAAAQRQVERDARRLLQKSMNIDVDKLRAKSHMQNHGEPVSDEERMLILQMLQDNKISVEQAEELLAALDG